MCTNETVDTETCIPTRHNGMKMKIKNMVNPQDYENKKKNKKKIRTD